MLHWWVVARALPDGNTSIGTQIGIGVETGSSAIGIVIDSNTFDLNGTSPSHFIAPTANGSFVSAGLSAGALVRNQNVLFQNLGTPDNGSFVYSPNASFTSSFTAPCAGGGTGAFVQQRNGNLDLSVEPDTHSRT